METISSMPFRPAGYAWEAGQLKPLIVLGALAVLVALSAWTLFHEDTSERAEPPAGGKTFARAVAKPSPPPEPAKPAPKPAAPDGHMLLPVARNLPLARSQPTPRTPPRTPAVTALQAAKMPEAKELRVDYDRIVDALNAQRRQPAVEKRGKAKPALGLAPQGGGRGFDGSWASGGGGRTDGPSGSPFQPMTLKPAPAAAAPRPAQAARPAPAPAARGGGRRDAGLRRVPTHEAAPTPQDALPHPQRYRKDPRGERASDETTLEPGWIRMDNGQYINVVEMSGALSDGH